MLIKESDYVISYEYHSYMQIISNVTPGFEMS